MTDREKGVEMAPCATCGKDLPVARTQADGGVVTGSCPSCAQTKPNAEHAAEANAVVRETGTTIISSGPVEDS